MVERLRELQSLTGDVITDIRARGMWIGLTFRDDRAGRVLVNARERGLLANAIGDRNMRFAPSLLISDDEVDAAVDAVAAALDDLAAHRTEPTP
jgi:acetylornithine/N-succinyldiaminopimelate aminotransferase